MNDIHDEDGGLLPEQLARKRQRIESLNNASMPVWKQGLAGLAVIAVLGGVGYGLYEAYFDVKPELTVDYYQGVKIASGPAQKDAQAAIAQFHASPEYAAAQQRARREMQQAAAEQQ